eukprot:gene22118-29178_t
MLSRCGASAPASESVQLPSTSEALSDVGSAPDKVEASPAKNIPGPDPRAISVPPPDVGPISSPSIAIDESTAINEPAAIDGPATSSVVGASTNADESIPCSQAVNTSALSESSMAAEESAPSTRNGSPAQEIDAEDLAAAQYVGNFAASDDTPGGMSMDEPEMESHSEFVEAPHHEEEPEEDVLEAPGMSTSLVLDTSSLADHQLEIFCFRLDDSAELEAAAAAAVDITPHDDSDNVLEASL